MIYQQRVIFGDTDQMGVVYYANYFRYFEAARAAYLRYRGHSYAEVQTWGVALPVHEAHCAYRQPARFEDLLDVDTKITDLRGASLRFEYEVNRDGQPLATGWTVHACVGPSGRPRRIPPRLRDLVGELPSG